MHFRNCTNGIPQFKTENTLGDITLRRLKGARLRKQMLKTVNYDSLTSNPEAQNSTKDA
jgi:hypothetical protein